MDSSKVFLLFFLISSIQVFFVTCTQFEVEDKSNGWEVPKSKTDQDMYNKWASKKRFKVDDTIYFSYKKNTDSVLVVTKEDYKNCNSDQPIYFSNDGYSVVILDRPGLFYFISGVAGRCEKGQKMIIKVMEPVAVGAPNQSPKDHSATDSPPQQNASKNHKANGAFAVSVAVSSTSIILCIIISLLGLFFF
ncbi:unnamed protein product [Malus baccata var. baccata]